jgi:hypothetical protein
VTLLENQNIVTQGNKRGWRVKNTATPLIRLFLSLALLANHVQGSCRMANLMEFASYWLETGCEHQSWCDGYDLNLSGQVDFYDFGIFADKWLSDYEPDSDGDGLSDFQEIHKYLTDPNNRDTDGDGIFDSDWNERREYSYTVRSILQFLPPFDEDCLNDDFQDARILEIRDDYIELEVIHYPLATAYESIEENPNWQVDYAGMTKYLQPGITTNWDANMKQDLLAELRADGIDIETLTDKQVAERVSRWLLDRSEYLDSVFTTYYIHFPDGQPEVYPGLEGRYETNFYGNNFDWPIDEHFDHELLGKGMFYNKSRGSCTSTAIYLATALKAIGIPTRMIIVVPIIDASDDYERDFIEERITHRDVRETILTWLGAAGQGFTAHTFNEVYVGNRWRRLNYTVLGQPILDAHCLGLHTHLYTFNDLSDANLAPTWGWRYGKNEKSVFFKHGNPYSAITLSELFGCHSNITIPNPPIQEHRFLTISKAYWFHSSERPSWISEDAVPKDNDGHLLFHIDEWFEGELTSQYSSFYNEVDKLFLLKSEGHTDIMAYAERGMWNQEFYVRIPEQEYVKMVLGVPYTIHPVNSNPEYQWRVVEGVTIRKENN